MIFVATEKERKTAMANCENCIKSDVCKYYEPKSTVACERYSKPVRHGHWIVIETGFDEISECSLCGYATNKYGLNFCPDCGSKMDKS